jgi:hypothetical protein
MKQSAWHEHPLDAGRTVACDTRPMMKILTGLQTAVVAFAAIALGACSSQREIAQTGSTNLGGQAAQSSAVEPVTDITNLPGSTYHVTFKPSTLLVDEKTVASSLLAVSDDGSILVFDDASPQIQALAPGKTVLFKKVGLRNVTAVEHRNNAVFVTVDQAALSDAIQDGKLAWNVPVDFGAGVEVLANNQQSVDDGDRVGAWLRRNSLVADAAEEAQLPNHASILGWEIGSNLQPEGDQMTIDLSLGRELAGMNLKLRGHGYLKHFRALTDIEIANGQLTALDYSANDLYGHIDWDWDVSKESKGIGEIDPSEQLVKLPYPKIKFPFLLGDIPFALEFSVATIVKPGFSGAGEISRGSFSVDYNGAAGFASHGGQGSSEDGMHGDVSINPETAAPPSIGSFGIVAAIMIPKIELKTNFEIENEESGESPAQQSEGESAIEGSGQESKFSQFLGWAGKKIRKGIKTVLDNEAGIYIGFVVSGGMSKESNAEPGVFPCTITTLVFSYKYGAELKMLGIKIAEPNSGVKKIKEWHSIDPPIQRCKDIATQGSG